MESAHVFLRMDRDSNLYSSLNYQQIHQELEELKNQHNIEVMRTCDVIGMTVTGATIRANLLGNYEIKVAVLKRGSLY